MNVNEYGVALQFCVSFNMSAESSLSLAFTKPDDTLLIVVPTLGTTDISTPLGLFAAYTYVIYTFVEGDVDLAGAWKVRLTYEDASPARLISTVGMFTVEP